MKYPEYLSSAKRHNHACRILQEKIETYGDESSHGEKFKFLVTTLYYLSGYMIECSLKFKILEAFDFNFDAEVNKCECERKGIVFSNFKIHDFRRLQNLLNSAINDISHESDDEAIGVLLGKWGPQVRYEDTVLEYLEVKKFYNHANCFLKHM